MSQLTSPIADIEADIDFRRCGPNAVMTPVRDHSERDVERAANSILGTSHDIGVEVARDNDIVRTRAKNHDGALWLRRTGVKKKSVVATIVTNRDIPRWHAASQWAYPFEIQRDDVKP